MDPLAKHPVLVAADAKLRRAYENRQTLRTKIAEFEAGSPYSLSVKFDGEWWTAIAQITDQPSPDLSVLVGDIAYQCYSAFHHVVWELASRKIGRRKVFGSTFKPHIQLPVALTEKAFADHPLVTRALVSKPALTVIEGLQSYSELAPTTNPKQHPLPMIKEIADSDKHRVLAGAYSQIQMSDVAWQWDARADGPIHEQLLPFGDALNDGDPIARIRFAVGNDTANVHVHPQPKLGILFVTDSWAITMSWVELLTDWAYDRMHRFAALFPAK